MLAMDSSLRHIMYFKNSGVKAGASLLHPHSQILGLPILPNEVARRQRHARESCVNGPKAARAAAPPWQAQAVSRSMQHTFRIAHTAWTWLTCRDVTFVWSHTNIWSRTPFICHGPVVSQVPPLSSQRLRRGHRGDGARARCRHPRGRGGEWRQASGGARGRQLHLLRAARGTQRA